jgi:hypothetical protein
MKKWDRFSTFFFIFTAGAVRFNKKTELWIEKYGYQYSDAKSIVKYQLYCTAEILLSIFLLFVLASNITIHN